MRAARSQCASSTHAAARQRPLRAAVVAPVRAAAGSGFGKGGGGAKQRVAMDKGGMAVPLPKKKAATAAPQPQQQQQQQVPAGVGVSGSGWAAVGNVDELFAEKAARPIILPSGVKLCVYKCDNKFYASQLESTAYQFPLFDGKVAKSGGRATVEVPLDGTQYDLATGEVLKWCPSEGGLVRSVLGALKSKQPAVPLKVYPTSVTADGTLSVKLV